jgi:endonuclease-3
MLIACVLLDRATKEDVERVMDDVFLEYPTPDHLATARVHELASMLHPLGIHTRRAQLLIHLAEQWCEITHG